jgi:hypothetical protein
MFCLVPRQPWKFSICANGVTVLPSGMACAESNNNNPYRLVFSLLATSELQLRLARVFLSFSRLRVDVNMLGIVELSLQVLNSFNPTRYGALFWIWGGLLAFDYLPRGSYADQ